LRFFEEGRPVGFERAAEHGIPHMLLTRRSWLGAAAATGAVAAGAMAAAPPSPIVVRQSGKSRRDYAAAMDTLRAYASTELRAIGLPGMTLCAVDSDGYVAVTTLGWADVDRRIPVSTDHFFQIGSISKAFAALTVFHLSDAGKIDLDSPLSKYLPDAMLPEEPITVAQVLSHTAGLPDDAPIFPRVPGGRLWTGFKPGTHFSYSNVGYGLIGSLIERITGQPHADVIRQVVREPIGMPDAMGVIRSADRAKYAVGYSTFYQDRPALSGAPLATAPWTDMDSAAGSIAATADQMAHYMRFLLTLGTGKGAPVLSDAAAHRFIKPVTDAAAFGPKARYGNGLATVLIDGKPCLHHTGGMIAFTSSFHADPVAGVACFASVNGNLGDYRPRKTTAFAVRLMRAVRAGAHLPAAPDPLATLAIKDGGAYSGRFVSASGGAFEIALRNGRLGIESSGSTGRLQQSGKDMLMTDHPQWAEHVLTPVREHGKVAALWWGEVLFGRDAARSQPPVPDRLRSLAGNYLNRDPWVGSATVLAQGDRLIVEGLGALKETKDGYWTAADDAKDPGRYMFDADLNGRAYRFNFSGTDLLRVP
jgi:CubicO group peptidase (beta-lactamase class C family)